MILGKSEIENTTITNTGVNTPLDSYPISNLSDKDTLKILKYTAGSVIEITYEFDRKEISLIGVYNAIGVGDISAQLWDSGASGSLVTGSIVNNQLLFKFEPERADKIVFTIPITYSQLGYIWVGDYLELSFASAEESIVSDSDAVISRGNGVQRSESYVYTTFQVTWLYEEYSIFKQKVVDILTYGYANPRPISFEFTCASVEAHYYVIFDSGKFKLDYEMIGEQFNAASTSGFRVVT